MSAEGQDARRPARRNGGRAGVAAARAQPARERRATDGPERANEGADKLDRYRAMRDFEVTPEPAGGERAGPDHDRFVIQQHSATRLHWDLRLERDGVLVSWACPRGVPPDPKHNRLAVHTEDHPLEYLEFSGEIPEGNYGAGSMFIWDTGTYETHKWEDDKVVVTLEGQRVRGEYALFRTRGRDWMIHRMDPPQDPERRAPPTDLRPMLATSGTLPADEEKYGFEIRWEGLRCLLANEPGLVTLTDGEGSDVSQQFPEVRRVARALGSLEVVLDGALVALEDGRPSRELLDRRLAAESDSKVRRLAQDVPVTFMAFDLLWMEGHPTMPLTYEERRQLLDEPELAGEAWQTPAYHRGEGTALLEAVRAQGLSGLLAKRLDGQYRPGERAEDWIEVEA